MTTHRSYMCMTDSARDKDDICARMTDSTRDKNEVTKDKKMTICLKLIEYTIKWRPRLCS